MYLFAWLLMLHIKEVVRLEFESIDKIPGERELPILQKTDDRPLTFEPLNSRVL